MDAEMVAMFPKGIRALIIDDDNKFIKSATMLLSVLNFDVVPCASVTHALKSLTSGEFKDFDVILAHAAKAAACGFDFRAIIEADLLTPVVYFLPQDHQATGDEADELLSMLQAGTYIMKKPLDINEVRTRLWNVIAWHKCHLEIKASGGSAGGKRTSAEAGLDAGGKDEDRRIHYKVVRARCGRKKKGSSGSGRSSAVTGGHPVAKGKEIDNEASQLQPAQKKKDLGKEVQKDDGGEAFKVQQPNKAMINYQQPGQHQPKPTLPVQSIPLPTYNPKFFTSTSVPSYDPKFLFFSDATGLRSNTATPSANHPLYSSTPSAMPPVALQQQHQPSSHNTVFGNMVSPAAVTTTMAAATTATYELPQLSFNIANHQQQQEIPSSLTFGPFAYQGPLPSPPPPVVPQQKYGGGKRADMVGMDMYTSMANPPQNIGDASNKASMLEALFSDDYDDCSSGSAFTTLDQVLAMASNVNEPTTMNTLGNINVAPFITPQVLSTPPDGGIGNTASLTPSNVCGLTLTGGAFGSFASSMVPQDLGAASNGGRNNSTLSMAHQDLGAETIGGSVAHQDLGVAPDGGSSNATPSMVPHQNLIIASNAGQVVMENNIMGPQVHGHVPAMQGEDNIVIAGPMLPSEQYEDSTLFPLEALLDDLQGPMFEFDDVDLDILMNGSISGGATAPADATGTSFDDSAISSLDGLEIPEGLFPEYGNNICG